MTAKHQTDNGTMNNDNNVYIDKFFEIAKSMYKNADGDFPIIDRGADYKPPSGDLVSAFADFKEEKMAEIDSDTAKQNIQSFLNSQGLQSFEKLTEGGANAYLKRGFGDKYPQGVVVRSVPERREGSRAESENMLQPYEVFHFDKDGHITESSKEDGIKVEILPEVISFQSVLDEMQKQGIPDDKISDTKNELRNRYNVACINEGYADTDIGGVQNLCVTPDGQIKNLDGDGLARQDTFSDIKAVKVIAAYQSQGIGFKNESLKELQTSSIKEFLKNTGDLFNPQTAFVPAPETIARYGAKQNQNKIG